MIGKIAQNGIVLRTFFWNHVEKLFLSQNWRFWQNRVTWGCFTRFWEKTLEIWFWACFGKILIYDWNLRETEKAPDMCFWSYFWESPKTVVFCAIFFKNHGIEKFSEVRIGDFDCVDFGDFDRPMAKSPKMMLFYAISRKWLGMWFCMFLRNVDFWIYFTRFVRNDVKRIVRNVDFRIYFTRFLKNRVKQYHLGGFL